MNVLRTLEQRDRTKLLCHAIKHLLDHCPDLTHGGDVEAVDILQSVIDDDEPICAFQLQE